MHAFLGDLAQLGQRKNLVTSAVGKNWSIPIHEFVESAEIPDHIQSRPDKQMVRVAENDLRLDLSQLSRRHCLHRALGSHWQERRRLDRAVCGGEATAPRF